MKQSLNDDDDSSPLVVEKISHKVFVKDHILPIAVVIIYFSLNTLLPLYTNELSEKYDYPLSATTLQVAGALIALAIVNLVIWFIRRNDLIPKSYIVNKLFLWKSLVTLPMSFTFALVIALTTISIYNTPLDLHVLLKATNIIWIVIFAWIVEKEVPRGPVMVCVAGLIAGSVLIGYQFSKTIKSPAKVLFLNLFTFFCEAVMVVVMKKVVVVLQRKEPTIKAHEIALTKLWQSFLLLLLPTYFVEGVKGLDQLQSSETIYLLVAAGIVITAAYQTTNVALSFFSLATTLGVLGQITIVPQTILAIVMVNSKNPFKFTTWHIVGALLVLISSVAFGVVRYIDNKREHAKRRQFLVPILSGTNYGTNYEEE